MDNEDLNEVDGEIIVCNISYTDKTYGRTYGKRNKNQLPTIVGLDLPQNIKDMEAKDTQAFYDTVETFAYNTITKKYGFEVSHCQIYLPTK